MYLLAISILVLLMRYFEVGGPVATMPWWYVLVPFAATALWWLWADLSGYTKRKAMERMDKRKADRHEQQRATLGLGPRRKR